MKTMHDSRGFSLMEVMIAVSILSVVMVGVMTLGKNLNKTTRTASKAMDMEGTMREIQNFLNNKENCSITVWGASGSANTLLSGLKEIDVNGVVKGHSRLKVSTSAAPSYVASGMIINGMFLRHVSDTSSGANYELYVTFMKSVRANTSTVVADATYGQNLTTRKIALQLDNCTRYVAFGNDVASASGRCIAEGGEPVGNSLPIYSVSNVAAQQVGVAASIHHAVACRVCSTGARTVVNGCI